MTSKPSPSNLSPNGDVGRFRLRTMCLFVETQNSLSSHLRPKVTNMFTSFKFEVFLSRRR